jgi:hypothetical protein
VVKVVVLLRRRSDMSREDFERYLRETHIPLLVRLGVATAGPELGSPRPERPGAGL